MMGLDEVADSQRIPALLIRSDVFPVPGLVEVWPESEALGVFDQPLIDRCLYLQRAVRVVGADRFASDVQIEGAAGEVRTVNGESGGACLGRFAPEFFLILAAAKRGDDLQKLLVHPSSLRT